jgi:hypothetical protein
MSQPLTGLYFITTPGGADGGEGLVRQGRVAAELGSGFWLVDIQEWAAGRAVRQEVATLGEMQRDGWWFFPDLASQQAEVARRMRRMQRAG